MSDLSARLREATTIYDASYPPDIFLGPPDPMGLWIWAVEPTWVPAAGGQTVRVVGQLFEETSVVYLNATPLTTTFVSDSTLDAVVWQTPPGTGNVTVRNETGPPSNKIPITLGTGPGIYSLDPGSAFPGPVALLTVTGTGYYPTSVIEVDHVAQPTTFLDPNHLTAANVTQTPAGIEVTVRNADNDESNSVTMGISSPTSTTTATTTKRRRSSMTTTPPSTPRPPTEPVPPNQPQPEPKPGDED